MIDDVPSDSFERTPENIFDRRRDRSVADFLPTHNLSVAAEWARTKATTTRHNIVRRLLSQPHLTGTFNYNSGLYLNVLTGFDANHDGNPLTDRPMGVGRNTFLGQTFTDLDATVGFRSNVVTERVSLELAFRAFNVLNRANFSGFNTVLGKGDLSGSDPQIVFGRNGLPDFNFRQPLTASGFGLATSSGEPRRIEFGVKLTF